VFILALIIALILIAYVVAYLYIDYQKEKILQIKEEEERLKRFALRIQLQKERDKIYWW
jgi:beta-lactamase regulating signal transducer with metallopeptidase domain